MAFTLLGGGLMYLAYQAATEEAWPEAVLCAVIGGVVLRGIWVSLKRDS